MMTNIFFSMLLGAVCASGWWALAMFSNTDFSFFPALFIAFNFKGLSNSFSGS